MNGGTYEGSVFARMHEGVGGNTITFYHFVLEAML